MVTVAPGTAAPVLSVTVPNMVAVESWACAVSPHTQPASNSMRVRKNLFTVILLEKKNKIQRCDKAPRAVVNDLCAYLISKANITLPDSRLATAFSRQMHIFETFVCSPNVINFNKYFGKAIVSLKLPHYRYLIRLWKSGRKARWFEVRIFSDTLRESLSGRRSVGFFTAHRRDNDNKGDPPCQRSLQQGR